MSVMDTLKNVPKQLLSKAEEATKDWSAEQKRLTGAVVATAVAASGVTFLAMRLAGRSNSGAGVRPDSHSKSSDIYESEASARQYMEFHYTPSKESYTQRLRAVSEASDFPTRLAHKFHTYLKPGKRGLRGLDVGCATGASVLEMSKVFDGGVVGIDFSEVFIHLAKEVAAMPKSGKKVLYTAPVQGEITEPRELELPRGVHPERCAFYAGDAMDMFEEDHKMEKTVSNRYSDVTYWQAKKGEKFDGVLCLNLIDRVPDPQRLIHSFGRLVEKEGVLILADPYSWWEDATPKAKWLGGTRDGARSEEVIVAALKKEFELLSESDEGFLIRDHIRHYQLGFSHCTVWRKK
ncbi:putative mitochondrial hypothetical protein [Leptomonas pyrrhocoris]|uniref:Methyltransferase domain-containing protein n=1 Tax=Leptomonas pyrrhocoris TaxID=157538 RepID=A0A0M9FQW6_LEPPY|nr:putative mitochondrial hypothetical protein [Leptomonas pyrrhocoris]KPA74177.1 putative mitochondrial hypothetical protein [Leptomonas pyrrhocoris]|eukprot:XP_015652616.1 putative mitochondrial hypothetical protein [Leptomonas pyrrhocoris]